MQQPIKRKKVIKFIQRVAKLLPERTYSVPHRLSQVMYQNAAGELSREPGEGKRPVWRVVEEHTYNNKRLCLHIYDRWGMNGLNYLFAANGLQLTNTEDAPES